MKRTAIAAVAVLAAIGLAVGFVLRSESGSVDSGTTSHGDEELARETSQRLPDGEVHAVSVAVVTEDGSRTATVGAPLDGTFELGSISKGITGMIYADMVERGEVEPSTRLGELLDLRGAPAADITLEELAEQRSGLPRLGGGADGLAQAGLDATLARNPYDIDVAGLVDQLRSADVGEKEPLYSNLGFSALGQALAAAADTSFPELVSERIAEPMGLESLVVPISPDRLGPAAVQGRDRAGLPQEPWTSDGFAPAVALRADADDMATLATGLLDGSAPGSAALDPQTDFSEGQQIGAAWITQEIDGRTITWHNGGTGGFRTWLGLDRERGTAVYIAGATSIDLDGVGVELLEDASR